MKRALPLALMLGACSHNASKRTPDAGVALDAAVDAAPADLAPAGPPALLFTVDEIPATMNGSQPYTQRDGVPHSFRLRVNRADFTLDAISSGGPVDWTTLAVSCDQPLQLGDGTMLGAGAPLGARFLAGATPGAMQLHAGGLPDGSTPTCRGAVDGPGGHAESAITFDAATLPPALDPFAKLDTWLVVLSRDIFQLVVTPQTDGTELVTSTYVPAGNGKPDFDEPLYALGLFSTRAPDTTAMVRARILDGVRSEIYRLYGLQPDGTMAGADSVRMRIFFEGDAGAPDAATFSSGGFSKIALGGDGTPADQANKIFGMATIDWNNQHEEDDTLYGLGVYPTAFVRSALANPLSLTLLGSIVPPMGTPIGESALDPIILAPDFDPNTSTNQDAINRYRVYEFAVKMLSKGLGSTLTHEIGHSLGLVPSGPPPMGMFAEMPGLNFTVSDVPGPHIDIAGLNVMQTGAVTNWAEAINTEPFFEPLSLAYLRRRLVVGAP
jgi:hypothetical protein